MLSIKPHLDAVSGYLDHRNFNSKMAHMLEHEGTLTNNGVLDMTCDVATPEGWVARFFPNGGSEWRLVTPEFRMVLNVDSREEAVDGFRLRLFVKVGVLPEVCLDASAATLEDISGHFFDKTSALADIDRLARMVGAKPTSEYAEAESVLKRAAEAGRDGRICLHEAHFGTVAEVVGPEAGIVFEMSDGPRTEVYHRDQFHGHKLPAEGTRVAAYVFLSTESPMPLDLNLSEEGRGDFRQVHTCGTLTVT